MPNPCFSYTADGTLGATQRVVPDVRRMPATWCFSYPGTASPPLPGPRQVPVWPCFSYPDDAPWSTPGQDAVPALRRMPFGTCFRY